MELTPKILALAAFLAAAPKSSGQIVGVTWEGKVAHIDASTGAGEFIGTTGLQEVNSMSRKRRGGLAIAAKEITAKLYALDPNTATATLVALPFINHIRGLAFACDNILYAVASPEPGQSFLWRLDLSVEFGYSEIKSEVGYTTFSGIQALTFGPDGTLYGWAVGRGLIVIDQFTGQCVDLDGLLDPTNDIQTLAFGPDGTLYGAYDKLYTIDPLTGAKTLVGGGNWSDVRGMEFVAEAFEDDLAASSEDRREPAVSAPEDPKFPRIMISPAAPRRARNAVRRKNSRAANE